MLSLNELGLRDGGGQHLGLNWVSALPLAGARWHRPDPGHEFDLLFLVGPVVQGPGTESPLEERFLTYFTRFCRTDSMIRTQVACRTLIGNHRLDFGGKPRGRRIGIECDGADFPEAAVDAIRDRAIIREGFMERIYRLPGRYLWNDPHAVLGLLSQVEPGLFSDRGRRVLESVRTPWQEDCMYDERHTEPDRRAGFPCGGIRFGDSEVNPDAGRFGVLSDIVAKIQWTDASNRPVRQVC